MGRRRQLSKYCDYSPKPEAVDPLTLDQRNATGQTQTEPRPNLLLTTVSGRADKKNFQQSSKLVPLRRTLDTVGCVPSLPISKAVCIFPWPPRLSDANFALVAAAHNLENTPGDANIASEGPVKASVDPNTVAVRGYCALRLWIR